MHNASLDSKKSANTAPINADGATTSTPTLTIDSAAAAATPVSTSGQITTTAVHDELYDDEDEEVNDNDTKAAKIDCKKSALNNIKRPTSQKVQKEEAVKYIHAQLLKIQYGLMRTLTVNKNLILEIFKANNTPHYNSKKESKPKYELLRGFTNQSSDLERIVEEIDRLKLGVLSKRVWFPAPKPIDKKIDQSKFGVISKRAPNTQKFTYAPLRDYLQKGHDCLASYFATLDKLWDRSHFIIIITSDEIKKLFLNPDYKGNNVLHLAFKAANLKNIQLLFDELIKRRNESSLTDVELEQLCLKKTPDHKNIIQLFINFPLTALDAAFDHFFNFIEKLNLQSQHKILSDLFSDKHFIEEINALDNLDVKNYFNKIIIKTQADIENKQKILTQRSMRSATAVPSANVALADVKHSNTAGTRLSEDFLTAAAPIDQSSKTISDLAAEPSIKTTNATTTESNAPSQNSIAEATTASTNNHSALDVTPVTATPLKSESDNKVEVRSSTTTNVAEPENPEQVNHDDWEKLADQLANEENAKKNNTLTINTTNKDDEKDIITTVRVNDDNADEVSTLDAPTISTPVTATPLKSESDNKVEVRSSTTTNAAEPENPEQVDYDDGEKLANQLANEENAKKNNTLTINTTNKDDEKDIITTVRVNDDNADEVSTLDASTISTPVTATPLKSESDNKVEVRSSTTANVGESENPDQLADWEKAADQFLAQYNESEENAKKNITPTINTTNKNDKKDNITTRDTNHDNKEEVSNKKNGRTKTETARAKNTVASKNKMSAKKPSRRDLALNSRAIGRSDPVMSELVDKIIKIASLLIKIEEDLDNIRGNLTVETLELTTQLMKKITTSVENGEWSDFTKYARQLLAINTKTPLGINSNIIKLRDFLLLKNINLKLKFYNDERGRYFQVLRKKEKFVNSDSKNNKVISDRQDVRGIAATTVRVKLPDNANNLVVATRLQATTSSGGSGGSPAIEYSIATKKSAATLTTSAAVLTTLKLPITKKTEDNKSALSTLTAVEAQATVTISASPAVSKTPQLLDTQKIDDKHSLSATTDVKITSTSQAVKSPKVTDMVIEIEYSSYYRHLYTLLCPIANVGHNYVEPNQLVVLKELINFYLQNTGSLITGDLEIAKQLKKILDNDLTKLDNNEKQFNHILTQCNQVINDLNFKNCKQMLLVFAAYYSFFPDKMPNKIARNSQIIDLLRPNSWIEESYVSSPHYNDGVEQLFLSRIKLYEDRDQPFSIKNPFDPNLIKPSVFLDMPVPARLKLITQLMRHYLIIKQPYISKNWCVFFVVSRFFEYIPASQRTKILSAAIAQFNRLDANHIHAGQIKILYFKVINRLYYFADQNQRMTIDTQNQKLATEVYQLLINDNKNYSAITRTLSNNLSKAAKNPLVFIINVIAENIHTFNQKTQQEYINHLIYLFKKKSKDLLFLSYLIGLFKILILGLKLHDLKQLILDTLITTYPKFDTQNKRLIFNTLQQTVDLFSEIHQKQILNFLFRHLDLNSSSDCTLYAETIRKVTPKNAAYIVEILLNNITEGFSGVILADILHLLPQNLRRRFITPFILEVNNTLNIIESTGKPIAAASLNKPQIEPLEKAKVTPAIKFNNLCETLKVLTSNSSSEHRDEIIKIALKALKIVLAMQNSANQINIISVFVLIICSYRAGTAEQKKLIFEAVKPLYQDFFEKITENTNPTIKTVLHPTFAALDEKHRFEIILLVEKHSSKKNDSNAHIFDTFILIQYLLSGLLSSNSQKILNVKKRALFFTNETMKTICGLCRTISSTDLVSFLEKVFHIIIPALNSNEPYALIKAYLDDFSMVIKRLTFTDQIRLLRTLNYICTINNYNLLDHDRPGCAGLHNICYEIMRGYNVGIKALRDQTMHPVETAEAPNQYLPTATADAKTAAASSSTTTPDTKTAAAGTQTTFFTPSDQNARPNDDKDSKSQHGKVHQTEYVH